MDGEKKERGRVDKEKRRVKLEGRKDGATKRGPRRDPEKLSTSIECRRFLGRIKGSTLIRHSIAHFSESFLNLRAWNAVG